MGPIRSSSRIVVVDCLRGFALMGLFIVHMVEYFELFWYAPEWGWVHDTVFFLFGGKAYAIFALLFGLSFFIMMDNQASRGVDFRARFSWRLTLLLALGYLHGLLYSGDILQVLALSGFLLVLVYPLSNKWILALAAACLLQLPQLLLLVFHAIGSASLPPPLHWSIGPESNAIYAHGSFLEVIQRNIVLGQLGKWLFMIESGRIWNIIGMFLLGFLLGRMRFFEDYEERPHVVAAALAAALLSLAVLHTAQAVMTGAALDDASGRLVRGIAEQYGNNLLTLIGVLVFLLAYQARLLQKPMQLLAPCGRMSLTTYVGQSLFGVPLFYGFGLGLYQGFGQLPSLLLGLALWVLQMSLARVWIKRYYYGPLEWAWRSATYLTLDIPWKRKESSA
jgi:uncharacterized protein